MSDGYYEHVRIDIEPLLPPKATRIVDVGCGAGATLRWLRARYPGAYAIGLEGNSSLEDVLARNSDEHHFIDLTAERLPDVGAPDLMVFLDVLEHLPDPVAVLRRLTMGLAPGGSVVVSVPNIAHLSVSVPLLVSGRFPYADAGILDRTHLRFFDQAGAVALLTDAGLTVDRALFSGMNARRYRLADRLTFGTLSSRFAQQFVLRGTKGGLRDSEVRWSTA